MNKNKTNWVAVLTMMFLFGMISFVTNLAAPIGTIWKSQPGIDGSATWGMMGNMMNFLAYLFMGLPAGKLILKFGYKKSTLIGVAVGFIGVFIQFLSGKVGVGSHIGDLPANFFVYLFGAFVCGISVCILNTVVNPMLNLLGGGGNKGNQLVQIGGTFNSLMGTLTPILVLGLVGRITAETQIANVNVVLYIAMGVFLATFAVLSFVPFVEPEQTTDKSDATVKSLLKYKHLVYGVIAIFFYVGVEVGIPGTLIFYLSDTLGTETAAATAGAVAGVYWLLMLVGRFSSSLISGKVSSRTQLTVTCAVAIALVVAAICIPDSVTTKMPAYDVERGFEMATVPMSALLLVLCGLCTSVMWGTIFNLSIEGLGKHSALASGMFMTMVVGGGVLPLVQNAFVNPAEPSSYMTSYWIIVAALAYMLWFAVLGSRVKKEVK
jgi:FHS family L-fucose permease-like MFS transporter